MCFPLVSNTLQAESAREIDTSLELAVRKMMNDIKEMKKLLDTSDG